jgi:hypothetical protein
MHNCMLYSSYYLQISKIITLALSRCVNCIIIFMYNLKISQENFPKIAF